MDSDPSAPLLRLSDLHKFIPTEHRSEIPSTPKSLPNDADEGKVVSEALHAEYAMRLIAAYCRALKDALRLYLPLAAADEFHRSTTHIRLLNGSNQAGKSLAASAEIARILRGMDPYKKQADRDLIVLALGKDQMHVGQVMWRKLWFPGEFQIVPDEVTGVWRSVRPDPNDPYHLDPIDVARQRLWQPSPPMIPPSAIESLAWEDRAKGVPSKLLLHNGTEAWFCTSNGEPRQGIQIDFAWVDEEVNGQKWLPEIWPRLVKRGGNFLWSYTPQESTPEAYALYQRYDNGDPDVEEFKLLIEDNPYLTDAAKGRLYASYAAQGAEQVRVRWKGEHAIANRIIYHEFLPEFHEVDAFPIPANWMRLGIVDPGKRICGGLFMAVPPDASVIHVYDELEVRNLDADPYAVEFKRKAGPYVFETYLIDKKAGEQTSMGRADTVAQHYQKAFERANIHPSRTSGRGFVFGTPDVDARELSVKKMLSERKVVFHIGKTSRLVHQIKNRLRDLRNPEKREKRTEHDLCDTLEYGIAYFDRGIHYFAPPTYAPSEISRAGRAIQKHLAMEKRQERRRPQSRSKIASSY